MKIKTIMKIIEFCYKYLAILPLGAIFTILFTVSALIILPFSKEKAAKILYLHKIFFKKGG